MSGDKPASLSAITASATRAERSVTLCVAGHLNARYGVLEAQLQAATRERATLGSLAETDPRQVIAEEMEAIREQMREAEHTFTFRALPAKQWSDLMLEHKPRENTRELINLDTFPLPCVAASLVRINGEDVDVSADDLAELWNDALNQGQRDEMFSAAWEANTGRVSVPFSATASVILGRTDEK